MRGGKKGERRRGCDKMFSVSDTMVLVALLEMESVSEVAATSLPTEANYLLLLHGFIAKLEGPYRGIKSLCCRVSKKKALCDDLEEGCREHGGCLLARCIFILQLNTTKYN